MTKLVSYDIFGIQITDILYEEILKYIKQSIEDNNKLLITYVTFHSLNKAYNNYPIRKSFENFDIIHPDGIGTFLAIRFIFGGKSLREKITGSDFYPILVNAAIKFKWKIFFWGDKTEILQKIQLKFKDLQVCGYKDGYSFTEDDLCHRINVSNDDMLIVGLGVPLQESWIAKLKDELNVKVLLDVGEGIKVFDGVKKRGPTILIKLGAEWFYRLLKEPGRLWKRYLLGIPLFTIRIIRLRFTKAK